MKKHGGSFIGFAFAALVVLVVAFLARLTVYHPPEVHLAEPGEIGSSGVITDGTQESIQRVEVTPDTVQLVIERLSRPDNYSRSVVIERFWTGGSGQSTAQVRAADGWTRVDSGAEGSEARHSVTGDGQCWIWYGDGESVFSGAAALSADEEQGIPTYENILSINSALIAVADYRLLDSVSCIYVETSPNANGYSERWWVSVEDGLLAAAERISDETLVYRMKGMTTELNSVTADAFTLPDGNILYDPAPVSHG
ncbi:MAG: hypothetical protein E7425_06915 [Ruminococcaceae bacterium]|jgi:hypothetical protein|nr:hypothetical protein [Oscillospiraceae bacterium]